MQSNLICKWQAPVFNLQSDVTLLAVQTLTVQSTKIGTQGNGMKQNARSIAILWTELEVKGVLEHPARHTIAAYNYALCSNLSKCQLTSCENMHRSKITVAFWDYYCKHLDFLNLMPPKLHSGLETGVLVQSWSSQVCRQKLSLLH